MDPKLEIILSIVAYSFCSGTLLLLNKLTLHHLPYPSLVTTFQLFVAVAFIFSAKSLFNLPVDEVRMKYVLPYSYYIIGFALGVYCNMKSLSVSNVETVIVFKALSPCIVAFADAWFLGREYPSTRSWGALSLIVLGAIGYASQDNKFTEQGLVAYTWPFLYLFMISFEMAYGKSLLKTVDLKTQSGPVLYTNMLGIVPMTMFAAMGNEFNKYISDHWIEQEDTSQWAWILLFLSSTAGIGIGYSSWWCRGAVSATSFSLIGVMNKCLTILLNVLVWDQHAPMLGILSLFLCLIGGSLYRQAPMRSDISNKMEVSEENKGVFDEKVTDEEVALMDDQEPSHPNTPTKRH